LWVIFALLDPDPGPKHCLFNSTVPAVVCLYGIQLQYRYIVLKTIREKILDHMITERYYDLTMKPESDKNIREQSGENIKMIIK
jgi:hypothetical protein